MSRFKQYKFSSRKIRTRYDQDKVIVSREDFEELVYIANTSWEQAEQLQTIIENLQEIKAEAVRKALDKLTAEIEQVVAEETTVDMIWASGLKYSIKIIDEHRKEQI